MDQRTSTSGQRRTLLRQRRQRKLILVMGAAILLAQRASADQWQGGTGDWFDSNNWTDGSVPTGSDNAYVQNGGAVQISSGGAVAYDLEIDNSTVTLSPGGVLTLGDHTFVGYNGTAAFNQTGGTHKTSVLQMGLNSGVSGTYSLSGGTLNAGTEAIGFGFAPSAATFIQSGGSNNVTYNVEISGVNANYTLTGSGTLTAGQEAVGGGGSGNFSQSGGTNTIVTGGSLFVGLFGSAMGTYSLSGNAVLVGPSETIGSDGGTGNFYQSGGTNTVSSALTVGASTSTGAYSLSAGNLNVLDSEYVGSSGTGTFMQTGGVHIVANTLFVGSIASGASGIYNMQAGTLTAGAIIVNSGGTFTNSAAVTLTGAATNTSPTGGVFTQNANGTLNVQINGSPTSGQYGQLTAGSGNLGGTLLVTLAGGYTPSKADSYRIVAAQSLTGAFNGASPVVPAIPSNGGVSPGLFTASYVNHNSGVVLSNFGPDAISFYDEPAVNAPLFGHVFVELSSRFSGSAFYGFIPGGNFLSSAGAINNASGSPWDYAIVYPVTDQEYSAAGTLIAHDEVSPPNYSLLTSNCVNWALEVASVAGITLPNVFDSAGVADPGTFFQSLKNAGAGNPLGAGTVVQNPGIASSSAAGAAKPASTARGAKSASAMGTAI